MLALTRFLLLCAATIALSATAHPHHFSWALERGENISSAMDGVNVTPSRPWTVREMKAAMPLPEPEMISQPGTSTSDPKKRPTGPAGVIPGGLPLKYTKTHESSPVPSELQASDYPAPYSRQEVADYTAYPYLTIGRLFFRYPGETPDSPGHVCTAASIGNQAIWTAGHCVHLGNNSPDGWMHDVSFVPAYKDGSLPPFGQWAVDSLETKTDWYQWGNWNGAWLAIRRDMGGAFLKLNNSGQKISDVVGWLGFEWNQPREQYWNFFGYPGQSSPPFPPTASRMFVCTGNYGYSVNKGAFWLGPEMSAMGCDMGDGSSGGPWISDVSPIAGASNYLGGNMSIKRDGYPLEAISPYFDDAAISLWTCLVEGQGC